MRINLFELAIVGALTIAASIQAAVGGGAILLTGLHAASLILLYSIARAGLASIDTGLARVFFAGTACLLALETAIQFFTGLHVNWFVVSLLLESQDNFSLGFLLPVLGLITAGFGLGLYRLSKGTAKHSRTVPWARSLIAAVALFGATQLIYAHSYFGGAAEVMQARRALPFFWAPHPYQTNKLLGIVLGPRGKNPFSLSQIDPADADPALTAETNSYLDAPLDLASAPNILIIVTDGLRAKDIAGNNALAPNMIAAGATGFLSLDHYSVSNCTHFSLYSLFTGRLPTGYGSARRGKTPRGTLAALSQKGYAISTAEAASLDWYDLSEIVLPFAGDRWIADGDDSLENDAAVTERSLDVIRGWSQRPHPTIHFAYYHGTHYPYSESINDGATTSLQRYEATIRRFDTELGKLLVAVGDQRGERRTLVIVTSDHGEEFLADGRVGHASRLSDEQTKVPLLVLGAGLSGDDIRSHLDIPRLISTIVSPGSRVPRSQNAVFLANCDYDYPSGFAVIKGATRQDFMYDDGYLTPAADQGTANTKAIKEAADMLLREIRPRQ